MANRKGPGNAPEKRLEADKRRLEKLAARCGEEAGLHRPLNDVVGGVITGIPENTDLAQALSDRQTSDLLVQLLDQNREQVEHALEHLEVRAADTGPVAAHEDVAGPADRGLDLPVGHVVRSLDHDGLHAPSL